MTGGQFLTDYKSGCYFNASSDNCNENFKNLKHSNNPNMIVQKATYPKGYCPHDNCSKVTADRIFCSVSSDPSLNNWYSSDPDINTKFPGGYISAGCPSDDTVLPRDFEF
jgi:hypothetical protein